MGTGASAQNRASAGTGADGGGLPEGNVFGSSGAESVGDGHALSAHQLQTLIQAGRYQYGGGGGSGGAAGAAGNSAPRPNFRSAKVAKNPFNLKKGTLRLVDGEASTKHVEFHFDALEKCVVTILYFVREYVTPAHLTVRFEPEPGIACALICAPVAFEPGANQKFSAEMTGDSPFNAADVPAELLQYSENSTCYPLVIDIRAPSAGGGTVFERRTAQTTFATLNEDGTVPKPVKQKVSVGGCAYELHDIYGISASAGDEKTQDDDLDDGDSLCVICLSGASVSSLFFLPPPFAKLNIIKLNIIRTHTFPPIPLHLPSNLDERTTAVLPCRHMCLCADCAQSLRTQSNKCPICRGPVQSLLHIKVE